eukprot:Lankesteria_metandrocarpae@DN9077_c0_g1_i3.p1
MSELSRKRKRHDTHTAAVVDEGRGVDEDEAAIVGLERYEIARRGEKKTGFSSKTTNSLPIKTKTGEVLFLQKKRSAEVVNNNIKKGRKDPHVEAVVEEAASNDQEDEQVSRKRRKVIDDVEKGAKKLEGRLLRKKKKKKKKKKSTLR